jgi:threonine dehydratase
MRIRDCLGLGQHRRSWLTGAGRRQLDGRTSRNRLTEESDDSHALHAVSPLVKPLPATSPDLPPKRWGTRWRFESSRPHGRQYAREMAWTVPTLADVHEARRRISPHLRPTPLFQYAALSDLVGAEVFVKHENHQPVGAFKVRGGVNLVSQLSEEERERGVIAASTGNHGQSIAFAARLFGVQATICVPEQANPVKVAAMRGLGAELVFHGRDFDDAREHCEQLAGEHGYRYVHSGNEPLLIAGVGTETLEILEERPDIEVIIVPVGGGSGAAGACIVAKGLSPGVKVVGVQSEAAPTAYRSWQARELLEDKMETVAEGLATRTAFELPQQILWEHLDDFVLVGEEEIRAAQRRMIESTRNLVEAAGAAPLAAALHEPELIAGKRAALILSGGNATREQLLDVLR